MGSAFEGAEVRVSLCADTVGVNGFSGVRRQSEAATALWIVSDTLSRKGLSKAPSPLRSAGALQKVC